MPDVRTIRVRGVIAYGGNYLFVKHRPDSSFWALPGGKLDPHEEIIDGLRREIVEELGIEPVIGDFLYVHQLFKKGEESLEFFFEIKNGLDYATIDLNNTTHGALEISEVAFLDVTSENVLPEFLKDISTDIQSGQLPKIVVRYADKLY